MDAVDCGGVAYSSYCGEVAVKRKGGSSVKFGKASGFDEEMQLRQKQEIKDGDRITTGRKSFMTIMGHPQDNSMQMVCAYPESEFLVRTKDWEGEKKGEKQKGTEISKLELVRGAFSIYPAAAEVKIPMVEIKDTNKKKDVTFHYIVDILPDMTVVIPGCAMQVTAAGKSHETKPWFGMMGMTELMVTRSGMFEKKTEVDARVTMLSSYANFSTGLGGMVSGGESMMEYSSRKMEEGKKKSEEAMRQMPTDADLEQMRKSGKFSEAQIEMSRAMSKSMKESGGSGPAAAFGMLAAMDFSKLKDMPGITPEQRKQIEEAAPKMAEMQKKMKESGQMEKATAQAKLSEKYMSLAATDPVMKKRLAAAQQDNQSKLDAYELPPYPAPKEWARVK